jgi:hypothetical protein
MSIMELGALGEFLGVFALVATLIYLSVQVRYARSESEKAVLEARTTGIRELSLNLAASEGLTAALVKAEEAIGAAPSPFVAELISHGLARDEARRIGSWFLAAWRLDRTQYETANQAQQIDQDDRLRAIYSRGVGRLFWDNFATRRSIPFIAHVNQLLAEADQETQQ